MTSDTNYVVPSASMIEVPRKMRPGGDIGLRSFRGIWCNENENNGPNLSQTGILLIMLGLVQARDDEMDKLGQKNPNITAGGGHTDIGRSPRTALSGTSRKNSQT